MPQTPPFGLLTGLNMPLRDALRGVASLADATEDALEPAAEMLPEPLRSRFQSALRSIETAGKRLMATPITRADISVASEFFAGEAHEPAAGGAAATVICYAWEHLQEAGLSQRHLISETILADRLSKSKVAVDLPPSRRAALLLGEIRTSTAIGRMPGLTRLSGGKEQDEVDLTLVAIAVWLMSARSETMAEEEKLVDLSLALVKALRADVAAAIGNPDMLANLLETASEHL